MAWEKEETRKSDPCGGREEEEREGGSGNRVILGEKRETW